ncbi:MAG: hypothetical protein H6719_31115 [Sandaracinaceae bacterium]|nr:hypothetical protein [Sandaracinaceae bacterium]
MPRHRSLGEAATDRWSVTLHDPTTGDDLVLGTVHVPDAWGRTTAGTAGFAEYFGQVASCDTLPHAVALLHQPLADGATTPTRVNAGTYGTCVAQATSTCAGPLCE